MADSGHVLEGSQDGEYPGEWAAQGGGWQFLSRGSDGGCTSQRLEQNGVHLAYAWDLYALLVCCMVASSLWKHLVLSVCDGPANPANPPAPGVGYREHAGRPAARARRVGFPAAVAVARSGSPVSGGRRRRSARRLRRHVERPQLFYQLGGGRVPGVRGAYLLGHVRYRLYPSVLG